MGTSPVAASPGVRRRVWPSVGSWLVCLALCGCGDSAPDGASGSEVEGGAERQAPPVLARNVLLVSLDTVRADRLESYGYRVQTSPNLDALARRSVLFERAQAQAPQTAPSHASLFTSEYPGAHQIINAHSSASTLFTLPTGVTTLAELLQGQGIDTAAFVSGGNLTRRMEMDRGFDVWDERNEDVSGRVDALLEWMLAPERGRFFATLHTYQTHAPYLPPRELVPRFVAADYDGPLRERLDRYLALPAEEAWQGAVGPDYWDGMLEYTDADVAFLSDLYDAEIAYLDDQLRRVLEVVFKSERAADTVVVVLADHGEEFKDHGKFQHDQVFQELLHVPLIMRLPNELEKQGWRGRVPEPVELVDVAPTVAELMGVSSEGTGWAGRSLVPLLRHPGRAPADWADRPQYSELVIEPGPKYYQSIAWRGWKYVYAWQKDIDHEWEWFFHLGHDPGETQNLIHSEEPEVVEARERLKEQLFRHTEETVGKAARVGEGGAAEVDDGMRQTLEQLGYHGSGGAGRPDGGDRR